MNALTASTCCRSRRVAPSTVSRARAVAARAVAASPLDHGEERESHVRQRQPLVGGERGREALLRAGAVGQQVVHTLLEPIEGGRTTTW